MKCSSGFNSVRITGRKKKWHFSLPSAVLQTLTPPLCLRFTVRTVAAWLRGEESCRIMNVQLQRRRFCSQIINCHLLFFTCRVRGDCRRGRCNASSGNIAEFIQVYPKREGKKRKLSARRDGFGLVHEKLLQRRRSSAGLKKQPLLWKRSG